MGPPPYATERKVGRGRVLLDSGAAEFIANHPTLNLKKGGDSIYPDYAVTADMLEKSDIPEDFQSDRPLRFIHRRTATADIYFIANPADQEVGTSTTFRVSGGTPQLWDPVTGETRNLPQFERRNMGTRGFWRQADAEDVLLGSRHTPLKATTVHSLGLVVSATGDHQAFDPRSRQCNTWN